MGFPNMKSSKKKNVSAELNFAPLVILSYLSPSSDNKSQVLTLASGPRPWEKYLQTTSISDNSLAKTREHNVSSLFHNLNS